MDIKTLTLDQLIESYISLKTQLIPRALAMQGLMMAVPSIVEAVEDGASRTAREKMAHAALLSGMCLANSGLGLAHGVAPALPMLVRISKTPKKILIIIQPPCKPTFRYSFQWDRVCRHHRQWRQNASRNKSYFSSPPRACPRPRHQK